MAKNFKLADIDRSAFYRVSVIDNWDGHAEQKQMSGADLISFTNAAAHLYDIHAEVITKGHATTKKITSTDYKRAARDAMKETFGFAPRLKDIIPMEGGDNGEIVTDAADTLTVVDGAGLVWRFFGCEDYDTGDLVSLLMSDAGTPESILDDVIVSARYAGFWD